MKTMKCNNKVILSSLILSLGTALSSTPAGAVTLSTITSPSIEIIKLTNGQDEEAATAPGIFATVGKENVSWTYQVRNTGNVDLQDVVILDDNGTPADTSDDLPAIEVYASPCTSAPRFVESRETAPLIDHTDCILAVGEVWEFTTSEHKATLGQYKNTATVTAEHNSSGRVVASQDQSYYFGLIKNQPSISLSGLSFLADKDAGLAVGSIDIENASGGTEVQAIGVSSVTFLGEKRLGSSWVPVNISCESNPAPKFVLYGGTGSMNTLDYSCSGDVNQVKRMTICINIHNRDNTYCHKS